MCDDARCADDRELRAATAEDELIRLRWRHRDGRTVWTEQRNRVEEREGSPVAIVGVARDVTAEVLRTTVDDACSRLDRAVLEDERADDTLGALADTLRRAMEARRLRVALAGAPNGSLDVEVSDDVPCDVGRALAFISGAVCIELVPSEHTPPMSMISPLMELLVRRIDHAAHELRTPLTIVLGAAQTLQCGSIPSEARARLTRSLERGTDDLLRHLDAVLAATDGLTELRRRPSRRMLGGRRSALSRCRG